MAYFSFICNMNARRLPPTVSAMGSGSQWPANRSPFLNAWSTRQDLLISKAAEMLSRLLDGWTCFRQEWPAGWANLGKAFHRHSEKPPKRPRADQSGGFWVSNDVISLIQDVIIPLWRYAL